jgi:serine phosphatase RsbU (regulator of sigma subunit)
MPVCRTQQNILRFVLQVHQNEEKDITEMVRITRTASKRVYYINARHILWLYSTAHTLVDVTVRQPRTGVDNKK